MYNNAHMQVAIDKAGNIWAPGAIQSDQASAMQWACISSIYSQIIPEIGVNLQTKTLILGAPFLRAYYTVYRSDGPEKGSIGLAASPW